MLALRVLINGLSMVVWGPMMFSGATRGAIKAFGVLFIGLLMAPEGPMHGILQRHTRGCAESPDAGQWSLSGTRWAKGGIQSLMMGYTGSHAGCCSMV